MSVYVRGRTLWISAMSEGARVRKSTGLRVNAENLAYVKAHEAELLREKRSFKGVSRFREMAEFWLKTRTLKPLTLKAYRQDLARHILPLFGALELKAITPLMLKEWQSKLGLLGLSAKRINNIRAVFAGILNEAVALELIARNPFAGISKPKGQKNEIAPLCLSEIKTLLGVCDEAFKNVLKVAFFTGLRPGELIALSWSDIDFEKEEIRVQRAIRHGELGNPKTEHSKRTIPLFRPAKEALLELKAKACAEWVFTSKSGNRLNESKAFAKAWKEALKRAGLRERVFYQTRHSFATLMIEQGENLLALSQVMGHGSPKVTFERYAKATQALKATFLTEVAL
ncbi:MAG: site-specific integrase [Wolinella sp.]